MTIDKGIYIKNIYYMLTYAFQQLRQNNYDDIAGEEFDEIYDLFAEILIHGISYQLKQGLYKEYIVKHMTLSTLKGKLNINGTINNLMQKKQKIDCDFDDLSENNIFNQIIKTTVILLLKNGNIKTKRKSTLRKLMMFFNNVDIINLSIVKWSKFCFDRNNKTYQILLYICYFIMNDLLMTTDSGNYKIKNIYDENMCRLYEKFVLEYYKKHFPTLKARAAQIDWNINYKDSNTDTLPIMQTDIMLTFKNRILIIDTKYYSKTMQKSYDKMTLHNNNIYQIQSYVINKDKNHIGNIDGMLLYAKTEESITPNGQITLNDGNVIFFRTLDLNKNFDSIKHELNSFIQPYQIND